MKVLLLPGLESILVGRHKTMFSHILGVGPCKSAKCKMHPHVCIYASSMKTDNVVIPYLNCFLWYTCLCCRRIHEPLPGCYLGTLGIDIFILFLFSFACSFCLDFATMFSFVLCQYWIWYSSCLQISFVVFVRSVLLDTDSLSGEYVVSNHHCHVASRLLTLKLAKHV